MGHDGSVDREEGLLSSNFLQQYSIKSKYLYLPQQIAVFYLLFGVIVWFLSKCVVLIVKLFDHRLYLRMFSALCCNAI